MFCGLPNNPVVAEGAAVEDAAFAPPNKLPPVVAGALDAVLLPPPNIFPLVVFDDAPPPNMLPLPLAGAI